MEEGTHCELGLALGRDLQSHTERRAWWHWPKDWRVGTFLRTRMENSFPQTSPPGHRVQENSKHVTTLTRVVIGIDGGIAFW